MTSDAVSVGGAHNSPTPSELFADRFERVIVEADIRDLAVQSSDAVNYNNPDTAPLLGRSFLLPSRAYPPTTPERT
jgi:hypothetical protein